MKELRSLYESLQARILEMIAILSELRASLGLEIFQSLEEDELAIERIVSVQREEIGGVREEAERVAEDARELAGKMLC